MSENVGASTSRNSKGLHVLYRDSFTFTLPCNYLIPGLEMSLNESYFKSFWNCREVWYYDCGAYKYGGRRLLRNVGIHVNSDNHSMNFVPFENHKPSPRSDVVTIQSWLSENYIYHWRFLSCGIWCHIVSWKVSRRFGGINLTINHHETGNKQSGLTFNGLHVVIAHKIEFFISTAV
jgi:hypothetical protein